MLSKKLRATDICVALLLAMGVAILAHGDGGQSYEDQFCNNGTLCRRSTPCNNPGDPCSKCDNLVDRNKYCTGVTQTNCTQPKDIPDGCGVKEVGFCDASGFCTAMPTADDCPRRTCYSLIP